MKTEKDQKKKKTVPESTRKESFSVENSSAIGTVCVHESVLSAIVKRAACSVDGVLRLAGGNFVDNLVEIVGSRKMFERSIVIEMLNDAVRIEVRIIVEYGKFIPDVASAVRKAILEEISGMTGMPVDSLDILVTDVDTPEKILSEETE